ncbi:Cysteine-rich repeat secretory protein 38 [Carex littledalei]|uniref:Cysteine-rich repeat secretory protein 38 n=1 Tax=Carex littledalei TaxID=544730 RepID=A0A833VDL0_9POAL|nr:Cysteine-rich repeat secretory protein 38 [Carex littledalei]
MIVSAPILVSLLTLALLTTLTTSHFIHNFCETTTKYHSKLESSHDTNLNLLFSSLINNTPKTGFSTATEGEPPYQVYGLALCRGDISDDNCTSCLDRASPELQKLCPYPKGGMVWYNQCAVRYSIRNFFSQLPAYNAPNEFSILKKLLGLIFPLYSNKNYCNCHGPSGEYFGHCTQVGASNPGQFTKNLNSMFESISKIAAFNESARMFATGVNAQTYGLVQCTRDLSEQQCYKCLNQSFSIHSDGSCGMDGVTVTWNCIFIYGRNKFFNSDPTWVAPPDHYRLTTGRSNFSLRGQYEYTTFQGAHLINLLV